jgi:hypothetical protein
MSRKVILNTATSFLSSFPDVERFEIGIRLAEENAIDGKEKMRVQIATKESILTEKFLRFLQAMNCRDQHIYIRPLAPHGYTLIDDVLPFRLGWAEEEGLEPCAVVETSPNNFQLWMSHGETLSPAVSTQAAKLLSQWFEGDPSSADYRHFGRFPGFTNPKNKYLLNGQKPFSKLHTSRVKHYTKASLVCASAKEKNESIQQENVARRERSLNTDRKLLTKSWNDFYNDTRYGNDCNRVDIAYAIYALSHGALEDDVFTTLSERDLKHKGSKTRQLDYLDRTIKKASTLINS